MALSGCLCLSVCLSLRCHSTAPQLPDVTELSFRDDTLKPQSMGAMHIA